MWQSIGNVIQFVIGITLRMEKKIVYKSTILLSMLTIGYICLVYLDCKVHKIDMKKGESSLLLSAIVTEDYRSLLHHTTICLNIADIRLIRGVTRDKHVP